MKVYTRYYRDKDGFLCDERPEHLTEEVFERQELGCIVDHYKVMQEYLEMHELTKEYEDFKASIANKSVESE